MSLINPELADARLIKDIDAMPTEDSEWRLVFESLELRRKAAGYLKLLDDRGISRDFTDEERVMGEALAREVINKLTGKLPTV